LPAILLAALLVASAPLAVLAEDAAKKEPAKAPAKDGVKCDLTYSLKGWSAGYKTASGEGSVTCDNGQSAAVTIKVKGGGLTAGKTEIIDGKGNFSGVKDIAEIYGGYAAASAHAGAVKSAEAAVYTKGEVSLALAGTGRGFSLGVDFGKLTIKPKEKEKEKGK
jgi:hypothetical protein